MSQTNLNDQAVFEVARHIESQNARQAYLNQVCGEDGELRRQVTALLAAYDKNDNFLESPPTGLNLPGLQVVGALSADAHTAQQTGTVIGRYKLMENIGEGGMGVVYVAEQSEPVRRQVALKIIKPGMDTKQVIARFEAERQALALMDHPHIAQVYDGGTTEAGLPYFVMELVRGIPITEFCDKYQFTTRQRLELFIDVCQAVQHAHQNGIIHRDLKPSNVMVTLHDDKSVAKVIDFGVAKAIKQELTQQTLYTKFAQLVGTPLYMSPEQTEMNALNVDTRSDVYSLGVLLYELLTGSTPFDRRLLNEADFDEMRRLIREVNPPRPSHRITTLDARQRTTALERRCVDGRQLWRVLRGELDWIVMKCLEKDRSRRYETVSELARDIERYLENEPVQARPPSVTYRMKKFAQKHRVAVLSGTAVLLALAAAVVFMSVGRARAIAQRDRARENLHRGLELIESVLIPTAYDMQVPTNAERMEARDRMLDYSIQFFKSLDEEALMDPRVRHGLGRAYAACALFRRSEGKDAETPALDAIELLTPLVQQHPGNEHYLASLAFVYEELGLFYWAAGRHGMAAREHSEGVAIARQAMASEPTRARRFISNSELYGQSLHRCGQFRDAETQFLKALKVIESLRNTERKGGETLASSARMEELVELTTHIHYAALLIDIGRYQDATKHLHVARRLAEEAAASTNSEGHRLKMKYWLASVESESATLNIIDGDSDAALARLAAALLELPQEDTRTIWDEYMQGHIHFRRAIVLTQLERFEEAISAHEEAQGNWRSTGIQVAADHAARSQAHVGELHYALGRPEEGNADFSAALRQFNESARTLPDESYTHSALIVFLCMCPNPQMRKPERAMRLAEQFIGDNESNGPFWRYLALARYRAGDLAGAEEAVHKSKELRQGGDALDLLLLAAIKHRMGEDEAAREALQLANDALAAGSPIFYDHIDPYRFAQFRAEVKTLQQEDAATDGPLILEK